MSADCAIATACHPLHDAAEFFSPNVVKVVTDRSGRALLFSRAPIPWSRDAFAAAIDRHDKALRADLPAHLPAHLPALRHVGLDWRKHVVQDPAFMRPAEVDLLQADPSKAREELGWTPTVTFEELIRMMVDADLQRLAGR